ncbi:hypothetical protein DND132_2436 [Pseudodesulfovibrio mercurii]|uniref:Uncharacterized protein n=1 Tax=Pseudodesulfovibrio mercurii TaxID=641491 RepID=F0JC66_9BACT|nr:hypothetical protein [Pseudodesulfovibrio mercurii]EGB15639.1 hypothetical protein DND132_2436 [Pseudodesulfovibrio mercurii]
MLVASLPQGARIVIYGAGGRGRLLEYTLGERRPDVTVLGYADTFKRGSFGGHVIHAPGELPELLCGDLDRLVVASAHADKIVSALPEAVLPRTVSFDPVTPPLDLRELKGDRLAVVTTRASQAALMNFLNLPLAGEARITAAHLDPAWTLSLWNPYLRGLADQGRIRHHADLDPADFDGAYLAEYGNGHVLEFFNDTRLARVPLCNAGLRARLHNTVLGLKERFGALTVVEFGSIFTVSGGNFSTLAMAEVLSDEDAFTTVNLDEGSLRAARSVCRAYPHVDYFLGTSGEFLDRRLDDIGDIHFACLLHRPCTEPFVAGEFERLAPHIPEGGRLLLGHTGADGIPADLRARAAERGFTTAYRDGSSWILERA